MGVIVSYNSMSCETSFTKFPWLTLRNKTVTKGHSGMIPFIRGAENSQNHRGRKQNGGCRELGEGDGEVVFHGARVSVE